MGPCLVATQSGEYPLNGPVSRVWGAKKSICWINALIFSGREFVFQLAGSWREHYTSRALRTNYLASPLTVACFDPRSGSAVTRETSKHDRYN